MGQRNIFDPGAGWGIEKAAADRGLGTPRACCRCTLACKVFRVCGCLLVTESIGPQTKEAAGCIPQAIPARNGWDGAALIVWHLPSEEAG